MSQQYQFGTEGMGDTLNTLTLSPCGNGEEGDKGEEVTDTEQMHVLNSKD